MKKSILNMAVIAGLTAACSAGATDLLYGLDFNDGSGSNRLGNSSDATGTAAITRNDGFVNWPELETTSGGKTTIPGIDGGGKALKTNGGVPVIGDGSASIGADTLTGFTISVNAYNNALGTATGNWKDVLGFKIGDNTYKIEYNDSKALSVYRQGQASGSFVTCEAAANAPAASEWYNIVLSVTSTSASLYMIDAAGNVRASGTSAVSFDGTQSLTRIVTAKGCYDGRNASDNVFIDNLSVYNTALTEEQAIDLTKYQVAYGTVAPGSLFAAPVTPDPDPVIPEPATATLSLLALAALAARRRRK